MAALLGARVLCERLAAEGAGAGPVAFKETAVFLLSVPWRAQRLADHLVTKSSSLDRDVVAVARVSVDELRGTLEEHGAVLG